MTFDKSLIARLQQQDRATQRAVFDFLYTRFYRVCLRYVGSGPEAEDCVMTGFLKVFRQINRFEWRDNDGFEKWSKRIMINESLSHLRGRQVFMTVVGDEEIPYEGISDAIEQLEHEELHACILALPTGYRTVLNLYAVEGFSHKEIAVMLGFTENNSKTQYLKAKRKLKQIIEERRNYGLARGR